MSEIQRDRDGFVVDATLLAEAFGLSEAEIRRGLGDGSITSRCETGLGADEGRWRLVFRHGGRTCRIVVDATGTVMTRACFDSGGKG